MSQIIEDKNKLNTHYLKLTTVSPVHIGTGESYDPTNFVIDEGKLYGFDEMLFYHSLNDLDKKSFNTKLHDWLQVIDFYKEHVPDAKKIARFECVVTKKVQAKYNTRTNKDGQKNTNQLEIHSTFKNPNTHRPIIPGSSIKGMLDTILSIYVPQPLNEARQALVVSDAVMLDGNLEIGYCYRKHKNPDKESRSPIPQIIELIQPKSTFLLTIKSELSIQDIQAKLQEYHAKRKDSKYIQKDKHFVLRVGKFNGKDFMVDSMQDARNSFGKEIATHTVYEDGLPFGWISAQSIDKEEYKMLREEVSKKEKEVLEIITMRQAEVINFLENKRQEKAKILQEKEQKAKAASELQAKIEAEEKARLASLNPFELIVDELIKNNPDPNASDSVVVYAGFKEDKFSDCKTEALNFIKQKMQEEKSWDKPKKKSAYKRTQEIDALLKKIKEK